MKPRKVLLSLSTAFSLMGCGPKPTVCVSKPSEKDFRCYDYDKKVHFQRAFKDMDKQFCLSAPDFQAEVDACKTHSAGPSVNACWIRVSDGLFHCYDWGSQKASKLTFSQTEDYFCLSAPDERQLLTYCRTLNN